MTDASLFAHIQNDAFLAGTYKLEGNRFIVTTKYLKHYLKLQLAMGEEVNPLDLQLLHDTEYMVEVEQGIEAITDKEPLKQINQLAQSIADDLAHLPQGGQLLLPGGWLNKTGGHAVVYRFTRDPDGYRFTIINSGAGLEYHSKKSPIGKELYNPEKTWSIPCPTTRHGQAEIGYFIGRLLAARLNPALQIKPVDEEVLYEELLPYISYLNGKEIDTNPGFPDHGWTGGQLSGTCAQRALHQMLKLNSKSTEEYQRKIFKFKLYNLNDYVRRCLSGQEPFTPAVAHQICLAINNNLKILNIPSLFSANKTNDYFKELDNIKSRVQFATFSKNKDAFVLKDNAQRLSLYDQCLQRTKPQNESPVCDAVHPLTINLGSGANLLENMAEAITKIQKFENPAIQYVYLEQLIQALPINRSDRFDIFYEDIKSLDHYRAFQESLNSLQTLLCNLREKWLKKAEIAVLHHLLLHIASLQIDTHRVITEKLGLPSFMLFGQNLMGSIVANHDRDPFSATNHPAIDQGIIVLRERFNLSTFNRDKDYYDYFKQLLATEPELDSELERKYQQKYGSEMSKLHTKIKSHGLETLYMISCHLAESYLEPLFQPIIDKVRAHFEYESRLRRTINPFLALERDDSPTIKFKMLVTYLNLITPLMPHTCHFKDLSTKIKKHKYALMEFPARTALEADLSNHSRLRTAVNARSDNHIQLRPANTVGSKDSTQTVTQADIIARDYFHLRTNPSLQIVLTLDYFTRHIAKLSDESNQRYVEANIFQPGLLLQAIKTPGFIVQFDNFLAKGLRFFAQNGLYERNSLVFLRLDFLVSRYMALTGDEVGRLRLQHLQQQLLKQLALAIDPDITYVLQQYRFLSIMAYEGCNEADSDWFAHAFDAYFYLQRYTNPYILEDTSHHVDVDCTIARFQIIIGTQTEAQVKQAVECALRNYDKSESFRTSHLILKGNFPLYSLVNKHDQTVYQLNAILGKVFDKGLASSGVPLAIRNHPLINQQGLQHIRQCFMSADGTYMVLTNEGSQVHLFYTDDNLVVHKNFRIGGYVQEYELQALTEHHLAKLSNVKVDHIRIDLPKILTDGSTNYWKNVKGTGGLLVQDNTPAYFVQYDTFKLLDKNGMETPWQLSKLAPKWCKLLNAFESTDFLLTHNYAKNLLIQLPRYDLIFEMDTWAFLPVLICQDTGELVMERPSPIHPRVAGLVLEKNKRARYLVPVARFYATEDGAEKSDFYPVIHDTGGIIAHACLEAKWKNNPPKQKPLWHYRKSEQYVSFQLQGNEPVADTSADALYLAYIYLATNQTEKAWKTLAHCNTHLGGLTGSLAELQYISWICNDLPHILPGDKLNDAIRKTPAYVACQLKAISLMCDYLSEDRVFDLKTPDDSGATANSCYALLQHSQLEQFLTSLPATIYSTFVQAQRMDRHLEHRYRLSRLECKRLLNYYHQSQSKDNAPKGALGYEWMRLHLEDLNEEREIILAHSVLDKPLPEADNKRLEVIEGHRKKLQPVLGVSTALELMEIDLTLPFRSVNVSCLDLSAKNALNRWETNFPGALLANARDVLEGAVNELTSCLDENDFIRLFPAWLQVACSSDDLLRKPLLDFCASTLLAKRHINATIDKTGNIPFMCNILYRVLNNPVAFNELVKSGQTTSFLDLVLKLQNYTVPALRVYQAKDVYREILATPEDILARFKRNVSAPMTTPKAPLTSMLAQLGISLSTLPSEQKQRIDIFLKFYRQIQDDTTHAIMLLSNTLTDDLEQAFAVEKEAGKLLFALEKEQKVLAQNVMDVPEFAEALETMAEKALISVEFRIRRSWQNALNMANQGPDDPQRARVWQIEKASGARAAINKADLMSLYTHADRTYNMEKTGLSAEPAEHLHELIHEALVNDIRKQILVKIKNHLGKDVTNVVAALDLLAKPDIPGLENPVAVLLQHEDNIVLRPRQVCALDALLKEPAHGSGYNETAEKVTMGDGKSKVITPILAEQKARGDNLVVVEVPQALLATNHVDLNRTSQRLYGKRAYRFAFNRDSNCEPKRLEQLYQYFTEIMTTRSYLVTTGESVQSLELKYLELLLSEGEMDETRTKQIYWLDKITNLFRHNADCLIDEIHQGLWIKKKLNYTSGESKPIEASLIKNATALYGFIDNDFIKKAPSLPNDYDWTDFKNTLATKLINNISSPLHAFIANAVLRYGIEVKADILAYLTNTGTNICEAIVHANAEERASLAFFKREIDVLLPQTLRRRLDEHYGGSKKSGLSPVEQTLAIPYAANNIPNERSRFGVELEAINYTIQMMLLKGISKELLIERIAGWQALARQELFQNPDYKNLDETPTARGFALRYGDLKLTLSSIDMKNDMQMANLHAHLQYNRPMIFEMLQEQSLKQIYHDTAIIHSDAYNHVDLYRSAQGVSGTPFNFTTFHQRLQYNRRTALGMDGYIIEVITNKKTAVSSLDYEDPYSFFEQALSRSASSSRTRSIIDIRATFQGVSNIFVASEMARYVRTNPEQFDRVIKQVLYFNADQILCAIDSEKPECPIILATSDTEEINRLLGTTPDERFTYYDQAHTVGTDITQGDNAHGLVLADEKTTLSAFLQGSMRQRKLSQGQTMEIIVPANLDGISLDYAIECFEKAERGLLLPDNLFAAKAKMTNHIRRRCLSLIQELPSSDVAGKATLSRHFRGYFETRPLDDLFELYGALSTKQATISILSRCHKQALTLWCQCTLAAGCAPSEGDIDVMSKDLQKIIDEAIPYCLAEYEEMDDSLSLEVEVRKEVQKEVELQLLAIKERFDPGRREAEKKSWKYIDCDTFYGNHKAFNLMALSMKQVCSQDANETSLFSGDLTASKNFAKTYQKQRRAIGAFGKPVFLIWYHMEKGKLHAMIITPEEASELAQCIQKLPQSWISTTLDTLVAGKSPEGIIKEARYQALREQVRFFNGELVELVNQETPLIWLKERTIEKLGFFENTLQIYRPESAGDVQLLKATLTKSNAEGFAYIAKHCYQNLVDFDWKILFPKIIPNQAAEYKIVAEVFVHMNEKWMHEDLSLDDLQQQFHLPIHSLGFLDSHLKHLLALKQILRPLKQGVQAKPFLLELSEMKNISFETCLGIPLKTICQQHGIHLDKSNSRTFWQQADLQILFILHTSPAMQDKTPVDQRIIGIAEQAHSSEVLHLLLKAPILSDALLMGVIANPLCDEGLLDEVLGLSHSLSEDLWIMLLQKCLSKKLFDKLLQRNDLTEKILLVILDLDNLDEAQLLQIAKKILEHQDLNTDTLLRLASDLLDKCNPTHGCESVLVSVFERAVNTNVSDDMTTFISKHSISPELNLEVLRIFGETVLEKLSLEKMIESASEIGLDKYIQLKTELTHENLIRLAKKPLNAQQIKGLLGRPEMTSEIADILFQNPHYNGVIDNWKWLTEPQLLIVLGNTRDYESFNRALKHENLSKTAREAWLENLKNEHGRAIQNVADSKMLQDKMLTVLEGLKIMACSHALKSLKQDNYVMAAKTAFNLYQELRTEFVAHFQAEAPDVNAFQKKCATMIGDALIVLGEHRGYKQILLDIVNVIMLCLTLGFAKKGDDWRFFKTDTASMQEVRKVTSCMEDISPIPERKMGASAA